MFIIIIHHVKVKQSHMFSRSAVVRKRLHLSQRSGCLLKESLLWLTANTATQRGSKTLSYFSQLQNLTPNMSFTYPSILE